MKVENMLQRFSCISFLLKPPWLQIAFAKLENILSEQNNKEKSPAITTASLVTDNKPEPSRVRLSKLEIPKFSGDALQWKSFWDQYNATIHSSTVIYNIEKFNYFKNLLTGSALKAFHLYL